MRELSDIIQAYRTSTRASKHAALATVVRVTGSAYRRPGARLLIIEDGQTIGGISGGCLEADVALRARNVLRDGLPQVACYDNRRDREQIFGVGGGCNGTIEILIEPLKSASHDNPVEILSAVLKSRRPATMATIFAAAGDHPPIGQRLVRASASDDACTIQSAALAQCVRELVDRGVSGVHEILADGARFSLAVETIRPPQWLVVFGAGSDAVPLVNMARELGWFVTVADHRHTLATPARFPAADQIFSDPPEEVIDQIGIAGDAAVVVMTHDFDRDRRLLAKLLGMQSAYLGVLGPARRTDRLIEGMPRTVGKIFSPIGLDLGAETPQEIALSILAEIQSVLKARAARPLSERNGPIHEPAPRLQLASCINRV